MQGNEYVKLAMRTNDKKATNRINKAILDETVLSDTGVDIGCMFNACLGLSGEVGETLDMLKKWIFHEKELDKDHLKKEIGDIMWYVAMMCHSLKFDLDEILQMNLDKLKARYPEGFDINKANNRAEEDI